MIGPSEKDFKLLHVKEIMENINTQFDHIKERSLKGMILSAILVRRDMEDTPPKIPVDYGNLRASFFITSTKGGGDQAKGNKTFEGPDAGQLQSEHSTTVSSVESLLTIQKNPVVAMGFSAGYAIYVHENLEANFATPKMVGGKAKAKRPGAGPRFFSAALDRNKQKMLEIIGNNAKIK